MLEARPDGGVFHAADPKASKWLRTAGLVIDQAENQLALPPGVGGADDAVHVGPVHEFAQNVELLFGGTAHEVLPSLGQDGQIGAVPAVETRVIHTGRGQLHQVSNTPAYKPAAAFQVAVAAHGDAENLRDGAGDGGLLGDNQIRQKITLPSSLHTKTAP